MERLRAYYLERAPAAGRVAVTTEMFDAVLAARPASPLDFDARLRGAGFLPGDARGAAASPPPTSASPTSCARQALRCRHEVEVLHLKESAEVRLYDAMRALRAAVDAATAQRQYTAALGRLAQLRPAVDAFFDEVMVMDENPQLRANRLGLLAQLQALFAGVADLSRLPG